MFLQFLISEDLTLCRNNKNDTKITFGIGASVTNGLFKENPKTYKMILCFSVFKKNLNHDSSRYINFSMGMIFLFK